MSGTQTQVDNFTATYNGMVDRLGARGRAISHQKHVFVPLFQGAAGPLPGTRCRARADFGSRGALPIRTPPGWPAARGRRAAFLPLT